MLLRRKFKKLKNIYYVVSFVALVWLLYKAQTQISYDPDFHGKIKNSLFSKTKNHRLAIVVPFRDRYEELNSFVPHMHKFLAGKCDFDIFVIEQNDSFRATLINIGYELSHYQGYDYMAMHDVDLLPANENIKYSFNLSYVLHLTPPGIHPRYNYPTFIGGILIISHYLFKQVDGMSNNFWGWGREDDEFYMRLKERNIKILRPENITTGTKTFLHVHDKEVRKRDMRMTKEQHKAAFRRDPTTGLSTLRGFYDIVQRREMWITGYPYELITVQLHCNQAVTPWCVSQAI